MPESRKPNTAHVFHFDLYGKREEKYDFLNRESLDTIPWKELDCPEPYHFFVPKDFRTKSIYDGYLQIVSLLPSYGSGVKTERDRVCIHLTKMDLINTVKEFNNGDENYLSKKFTLEEDSRDWKLKSAIQDVQNNYLKDLVIEYDYRPFDIRWTFYTGHSRGFIGTPGPKRAWQLIGKENISIVICRQQSTFDFQHAFISNRPSDICFISSQTKETGYIFPLYLYSEKSAQQSLENTSPRQPNLNLQIVGQIAEKLGLRFTPEKESEEGTFAPIDLLDYIYAVLHSPTYRKKYKEFLKIDFPRVPWPENPEVFWTLVKLGGELRQIHLLESPVIEKFMTIYPVSGDNVVEKVRFEETDSSRGRVWINNIQYFGGVPKPAWEFYIGGYQPAQKWLKDRKGRTLSFDDIRHYQKIIVALMETERIMREIDRTWQPE